MFRILQTTWVDEFRARQRQRTDVDSEALEAVAGVDGRIVVEARSDARRVRAAIAELPEEQREVLMMVTVDGLSYKDTAQALEVPIGTVMSRLARARARLADALGEGV